MHWIRHSTLTWVERNFGYAVARAYAGHTDRGSDAGATTTSVRATVSEVATALAALTGERTRLPGRKGDQRDGNGSLRRCVARRDQAHGPR